VLLAEPPRSQYDLQFHALGIPVRVHPLFWVTTLLLGLSGSKEPADMLVWVAVAFVSILAHEMGHALAARSQGYEPWITLYAMGGLASYQPARQSPARRILVTAAGPAAGFLFALVVTGVIALSGHEVQFTTTAGWPLPVEWNLYDSMRTNRIVFDLLYINIFWGLLNLLPIYPLDGGQIARELFGLNDRADGVRQSLFLSVVTAVAMAALALLKWHDQFLAFFFGYLAYISFQGLQGVFGSRGGFR
jgi:stage IV sporulation protein FB